MDIVVCVKQALDTEAVIELDDAGNVIREGQTLVIDPYSEFAVEKALQLVEAQGGSVMAFGFGDEECTAALRHAVAMGADEAVLVESDGWADADVAVCAAELAHVIEQRHPDLVLGGWKSGDTAEGQVMGRIAETLGMPFATMAVGLDVTDGTAQVTCEVDDGVVTVDLPLPAVVAAQQGLAEPRYPSVRDVMQARRKKIEHVDPCGAATPAASLQLVSRALKERRAGGRIVEGDSVGAVAKETARLLATEAKVI